MTTRTAIKTKWLPRTRVPQKSIRSQVDIVKPYTCPEGASIDDLLANYGYLAAKNPLWLGGFYPRHELEAAADRIRAKLAEGRAGGQPGNVLVLRGKT